jgi:hypothetical protein
MNKNMSAEDAHIRTAIALVLVLIALFFIEQPALRIIFALVAGVLATTAFLRTCPVYNFLYNKKPSLEKDVVVETDTPEDVAPEAAEALTEEPTPVEEVETPEQEKK